MLFTITYNELSFYTLAHPDQLYFIHQHIVDAQTAQTADATTKQVSIFLPWLDCTWKLKEITQAGRCSKRICNWLKTKVHCPQSSYPKKEEKLQYQKY